MCVGIAVGVVSWGAVGAWTAVTVGNYPWNKWIPFAYGATKGVLLGLLAAAGALAVLRTGRRLPVFVLAFVGGGLLGTVRDLLGPPAPPCCTSRTLFRPSGGTGRRRCCCTGRARWRCPPSSAPRP
ncbi:hypothetical protein ACFSTC_53690 [Nonomuraea ferruginea]